MEGLRKYLVNNFNKRLLILAPMYCFPIVACWVPWCVLFPYQFTSRVVRRCSNSKWLIAVISSILVGRLSASPQRRWLVLKASKCGSQKVHFHTEWNRNVQGDNYKSQFLNFLILQTRFLGSSKSCLCSVLRFKLATASRKSPEKLHIQTIASSFILWLFHSYK